MPTPQHAEELFTEHIHLRITKTLNDSLNEIATRKGGKTKLPDICRDALRMYIAQQEDVIGSRAHFTKTLRERFDQLENTMTAQFNNTQQRFLQQNEQFLNKFMALAL